MDGGELIAAAIAVGAAGRHPLVRELHARLSELARARGADPSALEREPRSRELRDRLASELRGARGVLVHVAEDLLDEAARLDPEAFGVLGSDARRFGPGAVAPAPSPEPLPAHSAPPTLPATPLPSPASPLDDLLDGERRGTVERRRRISGFEDLRRSAGSWPPSSTPPAQADDVDVTVFSVAEAAPGDALLVQVFLHSPAAAGHARALAAEFDPDAARRGFTSLDLGIERGARVGVELEIPGLQIDPPERTVVWRGRADGVQFAVHVPPDAPLGRRIATVRVSLGSVAVGDVKFTLRIASASAAAAAPAGEDARAYGSAFVSYAHEDRAEVLRRVQMLRAAHIECWQDVLDLDPGERWERRLYERIDRSDVLFLFWSAAAHDSEWVRREVGYALARGGDFDRPDILPVIIEMPPCAPWPELADRHFDDPIARLIAAE